MPKWGNVTKLRNQWAAPGDVNAFFGLMLDNIADLLLTVSLLHLVFTFPINFALRYMVPGTAVGVLLGDLLFFAMALKLARRTGRDDVTAMPLGLDTPSTFGMVFFVLGPAFLHAKGDLGLAETEAAIYTWRIGICAIFISGLFKFACAIGSGWIRKVVPRAGLLGSLAAVALVLISFLPLLEILHYPVVGMMALAVILTTLVARVRLPWRIPGALGALLIAGGLYYLMLAVDQYLPGVQLLPHAPAGGISADDARSALLPYEWLTVFRFEWVAALKDSLHYLPIVIPFALGTVVGGIDCTESAAAAGDEYDTLQVIGVEALATVVAALCGGVIQTVPYIGHPAYKAMGGRSAYVLATALFVGGAGLLGYFGFLYLLIPKACVFPILVFIGLEITAQSYHATPKRHYAAVALACVPALAAMVMILLDQVGTAHVTGPVKENLQTLRILANGFIVTSLLWASALAAMIDRRLCRAAIYFGIASVCSLFGIIHSPLRGSPLVLPMKLDFDTILLTQLEPEMAQWPIRYACGYAAVAVMMLLWGWWLWSTGVQPITDEEPAK